MSKTVGEKQVAIVNAALKNGWAKGPRFTRTEAMIKQKAAAYRVLLRRDKEGNQERLRLGDDELYLEKKVKLTVAEKAANDGELKNRNTKWVTVKSTPYGKVEVKKNEIVFGARTASKKKKTAKK